MLIGAVLLGLVSGGLSWPFYASLLGELRRRLLPRNEALRGAAETEQGGSLVGN